jgi:hypothetical protein
LQNFASVFVAGTSPFFWKARCKVFDIDLYLALLQDLRDRLKHDDPVIQKAAETDYERCARAPNFAAALMEEVAPHASAAREALRSGAINDYPNPSQKQLATLKAICAKAQRGDA